MPKKSFLINMQNLTYFRLIKKKKLISIFHFQWGLLNFETSAFLCAYRLLTACTHLHTVNCLNQILHANVIISVLRSL